MGTPHTFGDIYVVYARHATYQYAYDLEEDETDRR